MSGLLLTCSRVRATGKVLDFQSGILRAAGEISTLRPDSQLPVAATM